MPIARPRLVLAVAASVAPEPPFATATVPDTSDCERVIAPVLPATDVTASVKLNTPVPLLYDIEPVAETAPLARVFV